MGILLQKGNFYCFQSFSCLQFLKNNQFKITLMSKRHILGLHSLLPFNITRYTPREDKWGTREARYSSGNTHPTQGLCFLSSCISYFMLVLFLRKQMYKASAWLQEQWQAWWLEPCWFSSWCGCWSEGKTKRDMRKKSDLMKLGRLPSKISSTRLPF